MSVGGRGPAQLQPETIGKYRIVEPIGRGGMGMIFKAHDPILDRLVALKVISLEVEAPGKFEVSDGATMLTRSGRAPRSRSRTTCEPASFAKPRRARS